MSGLLGHEIITVFFFRPCNYGFRILQELMGDFGLQVVKTIYVHLRKTSDWTLNAVNARTSILSHRQRFSQVHLEFWSEWKRNLLLRVSDNYSFHYHRIDLISPTTPCRYFQQEAIKGKCCQHYQRKDVFLSKQLIRVILITCLYISSTLKKLSPCLRSVWRVYAAIRF